MPQTHTVTHVNYFSVKMEKNYQRDRIICEDQCKQNVTLSKWWVKKVVTALIAVAVTKRRVREYATMT